MIIYNLLHFRNLNTISSDNEYKTIRLRQVHGILPVSVSGQAMTASDMKLNQHIHGIRRLQLVDALMNFVRHFSAVCFSCFLRISTNFLDFLIPVLYFQRVTSFTYQVNFMIALQKKLYNKLFTLQVNIFEFLLSSHLRNCTRFS